jgi:hypothetical protein
MRILVLCLVIPFFVASTARADEEDPFLSVSEAMPLRQRWQDCAAQAVKRHLDSERPAEAVADLAFAACKSREAALANVLGRRLGKAAARRIVTELRNYDRLVLTRIIERLRGK